MNTFGLNCDPIFYLLPVATIVPECHHTLLEVALSLSLNRMVGSQTGVDYVVGLYSTLMPKQGQCLQQFDDARRQCLGIINDFEGQLHNRLMMMYYKQPGLSGGCFLFDKDLGSEDRKVWELMCSADDNLLQAFRRATAWPTKAEVSERIRLYT